MSRTLSANPGAAHRAPIITGHPAARKRVMLLNQFVPPDPAPTARLAGDLMRLLPELDWCPLGCERPYRGPRAGGFARRLWNEWTDLRALGRAARSAPRPDCVLALSSPPMLVEEARRVAAHHRVPLHHWVLDLYPDVALALGQIPAAAGAFFSRLMTRALKSCASVTAVDETMANRLAQLYQVPAAVCRPWPEEASTEPFHGWPGVPSDAPVWLYSGNLGLAHDSEVLLQIQAQLEARSSPWWLVIQGGGNRYRSAQASAAHHRLKQCVFLPYLPAAQLTGALAQARVCVATQRCETAGMLWPSKVATLAERARAVLWLGPELEGATHPLLHRPAVGAFRPNQIGPAADWLEAQREMPRPQPLANRVGLREAAVTYWREILLR